MNNLKKGIKNNKRLGDDVMSINIKPIGYVSTDADKIPRHWTVSDVEGTLVINSEYTDGLRGIEAGHRIMVIFHFHESRAFTPELLIQESRHRKERCGVFSICSPLRPNPIGLSVLEVTEVKENLIKVKGLDMLDGTPVLDIKPCIKG